MADGMEQTTLISNISVQVRRGFAGRQAAVRKEGQLQLVGAVGEKGAIVRLHVVLKEA